MERQSPSTSDAPSAITTPLLDPRLLRRVVVEAVAPEIDGGRLAIKRTPGEQVIVEADVYADGHDTLGAAVLWRRRGDERWNETAMTPLGNDRWRAAFAIGERRDSEYTVEGWIDRFESWRQQLSKKVAAGQDVGSELQEGAHLIVTTASRASAADNKTLSGYAAALENTGTPAAERVVTALDAILRELMSRH